MKPRNWIGIFFLGLLAFTPLAHSTLREAFTITAGPRAALMAVDRVTGRVFVANPGDSRGGPASLSVIETDGTTRTLATPSTPYHIAVAANARSVLVTQSWSATVLVIDADTLQVRGEVAFVGSRPARSIVLESLGRAYVIARNDVPQDWKPWENPGGMSGSLVEIDLATLSSRSFPINGMDPRLVVADQAAGRIFIAGTQYWRTGEGMPGYVNSFDAATRTFAVATPVTVGRLPQDLVHSAVANELYILGHADFLRPEFTEDPISRNSFRATLFVLGTDLAVKRAITLPDTTDMNMIGPQIVGGLAFDAAAGRVFVLDTNNKRLNLVDPSLGSVVELAIETWSHAIAFEPRSRNILVAFPFAGYTGVFSANGARLDSVPLASTATVNHGYASHIVVNEQSGDAYVSTAHNNSVTRLAAAPAGQAASTVNMTDLWWNPADSGWGVFIEQQGTTMFAAMFLKDAQGAPRWYVMPAGKRLGDGSFTGDLYRTRGPVASALANAVKVGAMSFAPSSLDAGTLSYQVDNIARVGTITRQVFVAQRSCGWTNAGATPKAAHDSNFTSLWFDAAQPGWGVAVSHRGDTAFGVLFGYDAQDNPAWSVMSNGTKQADGAFLGQLYRVAGSDVLSVGAMALRPMSASEAILMYAADGAPVARPVTRQVFAPLVSDCAN